MPRSSKMRMFWNVWSDSLASLRSIVTLYPFLIYAVFQVALLLSLVYFAYPPFSSVLVPLIRSIFGERALHYPNNYLVLAPLFGWGNIILSGVVGAATVGIATYLFAMRYWGKPPRLSESVRRTAGRYLLLFGVWLVETVLILAAAMALPLFLQKAMSLDAAQVRLLRYVGLALAIIIGALFAYTSALVMLARRGFVAALIESVSSFAKAPVVTIFLVAIPTFLRFPTDYLASKAPYLITKFSPEIMIVVVSTSIVVSVFANYFLVGTVTYFFMRSRVRS